MESPFQFGGIDAEMLEEMVLGEIVLQTMGSAEQVKEATVFGKRDVKAKLAAPEKLFPEAVDKSFKSLSKDLTRHYDGMMKVAKAMYA